jgi:hypothetical protein
MASSSQQPFEVNDFSGGITDDVFLQDPKFCKTLDNFLIQSDKTPTSRDGSIIEDDTNPQLPTGNNRIGALINYANSDKLFYQSVRDIFYRNPSAFTALVGPTSNKVFSVGTTLSEISFTQWNKHLYVTNDSFARPMKIYKDDTGAYKVRTNGLPSLASSPTVTAGAAGTNDYVYAFNYEYTYMVGNQTFIDEGPTTLVSLENAAAPDSNTVAITGLPVISNGATDNWDTTVIKLIISRTISGGDIFYKAGEVTNGTTTFNDNTSDTNLQLNDPLYTNDGTLDFDPVPLHKYAHIINNTAYYASTKEGSEEFPYKIRQSIPGNPSACPGDFEVEVEDEIKGISSVRSVPIVLCRRHIYRIEQAFDQFGRGNMVPVRISDTAGCVSNLSIVQAENGLFWAGNDGYYYTDGYQTLKISDHLNTSYKRRLAETTQQNRIYGRYDEKERNIYWCVQSNSGNLDNDTFFILDLKWGISETCRFSTWSGNSFRPSCLEFFNGFLYRGDTRGYVFKHDSSYFTDPKVNTAAAASTWDTETIIWTYQSINYNFGSSFFRKMPIKTMVTASNRGNTTIQISAINDDGKITRNCKPIRVRTNFVWGDTSFIWGNPSCVWNSVGLIEQWRRLPSHGLRLSYMSLVITNGFSAIDSSDLSGTATFDPTLNTVVLDGAGASWPMDVVDYVIASEVDGYVTEYTVTARNSDTSVTVADPNNTLPIGSIKWVLRGFQKGETLNLLGYNIHWTNVSQTQQTFELGSSGENN